MKVDEELLFGGADGQGEDDDDSEEDQEQPLANGAARAERKRPSDAAKGRRVSGPGALSGLPRDRSRMQK